jgi:hypothetical protein
MPILNETEEWAGALASNPPAALRTALEAAAASHYQPAGNTFDYARFATSAEYDELRTAAESLTGFDCGALNIGQRMPFWLNVYNALVLDAVVSRSITDSIRSAGDFYEQSKYEVGGLAFSLDDIEHGMLRANEPARKGGRRPMKDNDPRLAFAPILFDERVHFALYSACRASPALAVYQDTGLDAQLEAATRRYLSEHAKVAEGGAALHVPKLFDWYEADFGGPQGVRSFVIARLEREEEIDAIDRRGGRVALKFLDYDWTLNSR